MDRTEMSNAELVKRIQTNLEKKNDSPYFTIGYMSSMLRTLAEKYPEVQEELIATLDWTELPE